MTSPEPADEGEQSPVTIGQWFAQNGIVLALLLALLVFLVYRFNADQLWSIAKAVMGLSLVIFVHELGHFLVAKWCDVHVTTFSIGFGPALPGCKYKWGETTYKIALLPLGGYVQMVGQVDGDEASDGSDDDPRSFRRKTVGQRMAIISAGVIMNVILAFICFVIVFRGPGKDRQAAVVESTDTGAPAFRVGLHSGAEILQIGPVENPTFDDLTRRVMASSRGDGIELKAKRPGDSQVLDVMITPRKDKDDLRPVIGIIASHRLQLATQRYLPVDFTAPVYPWSSASEANPGFQFGDWIMATTDPDDPSKVTDLPVDPRLPNGKQRDYFEFHRRMVRLAGKDVVIRVQRGTGAHQQPVDITVPPAYHYALGVTMHIGQITAIRDKSPAAVAGLVARDKNANTQGDLIVAVKVKEPDGKETVFADATLDPMRLPYQLREWAQRLDEAKVKKPWKVTLELLRSRVGVASGPDHQKVVAELDWDDSWRFDRTIPLSPSSPLAIPELGLAYLVKNTVASVHGDGPKDNPLQPWDGIKEVRLTSKNLQGKEEVGSWSDLDSDENWAYLYSTIFGGPSSTAITQVELKITRGKDNETQIVSLVPVADKSWPLSERGLWLMKDDRRQKASNIPDAIVLGLRDTHNNVMQVFETLRGIITRRHSVKILGGPITIARAAFYIAGIDFWEFVFFLGMISINLAVINFLPIPVLDGGHMVFLLYEKIRGKPASESVRIGATYAGLALILSVMVLVFYLDISKLF